VDITHIEDGIYQGGFIDEPNELPPYINAVVDLQAEHQDILRPDQILAFAWFPLKDIFKFPGVHWLDMVVDTVIAFHSAGLGTLIHCAAGISRAGMVDAAYWMKRKNWTPQQSLDFIRSKRPITYPNICFINGLAKYYYHLNPEGVKCEPAGQGSDIEEDEGQVSVPADQVCGGGSSVSA